MEQLLVRQSSLVLGNQGGRHRPRERVFDDLVILGRAQEHADGRLLVRLLHVAVEGLQVELEFAQVLRLELDDLEFKRDQAVECAIEEEQIEFKVSSANLNRVMTADVAEVAAEFDQELLELLDQTALQVGLGMPRRKVEELDEVAVLEDGGSVGM